MNLSVTISRIHTVERGTTISDPIFLFKVLNCRIVCPELQESIPINAASRIIRVALPFGSTKHGIKLGHTEPINKISNLANSLATLIFSMNQRIRLDVASTQHPIEVHLCL